MKLINKLSLAALAAAFTMSSCDKTELYDVDVASPEAHFVGEKFQSYPVRGTGTIDAYSVQVGTTDVSSADRVVTYNITSPSGAVAGTQYTVTGNTVTIAAGKAVASIAVQGILAGFPAGRIDTLVFTLAQPSLKPSGFLDTVKLAIGDICSESNPFDINSFAGNYLNTNETFSTSVYGPYPTTISSITSTGATTATIVIENIWDNGWGPLSFELDWTDPLAKTTKAIAQAAIPGSDAGDINPAYAGLTIAMRPFATGNLGTFSSCGGTVQVKMQLGVTGLGFFAPVYTVNLAR